MKRAGLRVFGLGIAVAMLAMTAWMGAGCDSGDGGGGGGSGGGDFVGVWEVTKLDTGSVGYYYFQEDGTFYKTREELDGPVHLSGTYTVSGGTLKGPFTNPGVGDGEIEATISNGVMTMDFVEFWHSPPKHVPCSGTKI